MFGVSAGYFAPAIGLVPPYPTEAGPSLGATIGLRFARYFYLGLQYSHAFIGADGDYFGGGSDDYQRLTGASGDYFGLDFISISHPDAPFAFFTEIGAGYRIYELTVATNGYPSPQKSSISEFETTFLGLGLEIQPAPGLRLVIPEGTLQIGSSSVSAFVGVSAFYDLMSK
jgi:hypothetical protein